MFRRTYKYRIYPNRQQRDLLDGQLALCCELYNAALQERRDAYKTCRKSVSRWEQEAQLKEIKKIRPEFFGIYSQVLQHVLKRVEETYQAFFRRGRGFPRFKNSKRYDSLVYPQYGFKVENGCLFLSKIGSIPIVLSRPLRGTIKTLTIKRVCGAWYACFSVELEIMPLPKSLANVGIDVGLENFATLSNGETIPNPRFFQTAQAKLRRLQRCVSRRKKGSNRWRKACALVAKFHRTIFNKRNDFQHKESTKIVAKYGHIVVENLNILSMTKTRFAKSVLDASWSSFLAKLAYKAESAGRVFEKVDARGTSQTCPCGAHVPKKLSQRKHVCLKCSLALSRDHAAAIVIQGRGVRLQGVTRMESVCVS
jgi:putative transposase